MITVAVVEILPPVYKNNFSRLEKRFLKLRKIILEGFVKDFSSLRKRFLKLTKIIYTVKAKLQGKKKILAENKKVPNIMTEKYLLISDFLLSLCELGVLCEN